MSKCINEKLSIIYISIAVVGITGHSICMNLILRKRLIKTPRFLILFCLSISDCTYNCTGIIVYLIAANMKGGRKCILLTEAGVFLGTIIFQMSSLVSVMLTLNQFIAISYGIMYQSIVTCKKIRRAVVVFGAGLVSANALIFLDRKTIAINANTNFRMSRFGLNTIIMWFSILSMTVTLIKGYRASEVQLNRLQSHQKQMPYWRRRKQIRKEITILTIITIIAQLPLGIMYPKLMVKVDPKRDEIVLFFARGLLFLFCAWNPWLYMLTLHELRKSIGKIMQKYNPLKFKLNTQRKGIHIVETRGINLITYRSITESIEPTVAIIINSTAESVIP